MANPLASSSNSSRNNSPYEVFINHRGPDTKESIAGHLYSSLTPHGLRVFLDKKEMKKGDFFTSQIAAAIRTASVHIAIFSPGYANSEWCLYELLLMLELMESDRSTIIPIFYHVKPADLRYGVYAEALTTLQKKKTKDYESDTIKNWRNALSKVSYIDGFDLDGAFNGIESKLVEEVVQLVLQKVEKPPLEVVQLVLQKVEKPPLEVKRKRLRELNASGCGKLQSIEGLAQLTGLRALNVANCCELKEIPGLEHLKGLRDLNASGCGKLQSIEGLAQLTGLGALNVANCCELKEIPGLEHLKGLCWKSEAAAELVEERDASE